MQENANSNPDQLSGKLISPNIAQVKYNMFTVSYNKI